jgi:hypothetical protein
VIIREDDREQQRRHETEVGLLGDALVALRTHVVTQQEDFTAERVMVVIQSFW